MSLDNRTYQLIDLYFKGTLSPEEHAEFELKMQHPETKKEIEEHLLILNNLKFLGERQKLQRKLDVIHSEVRSTIDETSGSTWVRPKTWQKYLPVYSTAAAIAFICVIAFIYTRRFESLQKEDYRDLRNEVEQIKRSQDALAEDLSESKAKIPQGKYTGTGFLISPKGYLTTSYHVIKEADSIVVENKKFGRMKAMIVHSDPKRDVSILRINDTKFKLKNIPYTIVKDDAKIGEEVYTLGFPRNDIVFGEGSISALSGYKQNPLAYQISIPLNPGNSGGPLINHNGDVIGMISGLQTASAGTAFAVKGTQLLETIHAQPLDTLNAAIKLPKQNLIRYKSRVQQIDEWQNYIFVVRVYHD
jgi:S1-C subfamily serine protease